MPGQFYCSKCNKTMASTKFFTYKDGTKCELCKACLTLHVNNWEPETYVWILEKFDVPYLPNEWNIIRDREYQKDPYKMTGLSVVGRYLSKFKLKQWIDPATGKLYTFADSERLQAKAEEEAIKHGNTEQQRAEKLAAMKEMLENGEISEAQYKTYAETQAPQAGAINPYANGAANPAYPTNDHPYEEVELVDVGAELTAEDKIYLAMKWGRLYKADEWVALEKLYNEFMKSFDIHSAATIDTLIMLCKTSLKMNQAIDCGDIDSYQKLSRVYDAMMKAGKFTEAQNKEDSSSDFDAIGCIVAFCEKEGGFIPRFYTATPQDQVDVVIADEKSYAKSLFDGDAGLAQQIEQYIKKREILEEQKRNKELARLQGKDTIEISDEDYQEFLQQEEEEKEKDFQSVYNEDENGEGEE